jgi:hypothetical protein
MAIEQFDGGMSITGSDIRAYKLFARKGALKLECKGLKKRGQSAYSICKQVYGFKGNKERVLEQMEDLCDKVKAHIISADDLPAQ